jgi:5-hydroxyisourate hydrolase-like protein (transthyretin family)
MRELVLIVAMFQAGTNAQVVSSGGAGRTVGQEPAGARQTQPPTPAQPTPPEDLCGISGQTVNAATGEPLRRVSVTLMRADPNPGELGPPVSYSTSSNGNGQFTMKDIEPGKYRLTAARNGFVAFAYGARAPMRPGTTLSLARQQRITDVTLKMTPHAVITGRILDEEGEPVANVRIMLQGYRYTNGRRLLSPAGGGASTNDLGEYRIFGVGPGKYYLNATPLMMGAFALDRSASAGQEEDYVATYYPGTIDPSAAAQIEVAAGSQVRGLDMTLSKARTVHVKGKVTQGLSGRQNIQVMLTPRNPNGFIGPMRGTPIDAAGNFDIRNVTPGSYILTATMNDGASFRQGRLAVDVGGTNLDGLNVMLSAGFSVKGQVRSDHDGSPVDYSSVRFMLQPKETNIFGGASQGKPEPDGSFEMKGVSADRFNLVWFNLPPGAYVKSARYDQVDVLAAGLDLTAGAPPPLVEVVLSPRAASVTGTVQNMNTGHPAAGATVVLIPQEQERRQQQAFYRTIMSDQVGTFSLTGIPPGDYKIYAWEDMEAGAYMDPDVIKPVEGKGESLTLREGDQKTLTLKLIPVDGN